MLYWTQGLHDAALTLLNPGPTWLDLPRREKVNRLLVEATSWLPGSQLSSQQIALLRELCNELDPGGRYIQFHKVLVTALSFSHV